jgi:hypothetical protein
MPGRFRRGGGGTEARTLRSPVNVQEEIFVIIMAATTMSRNIFIFKNKQGPHIKVPAATFLQALESEREAQRETLKQEQEQRR